MRQKSRWDIVAATIIGAIAIFVLATTYVGFGAPFADAGGIYPETLPRVYGYALLLLSLVLAFEAWSQRKAPLSGDADETEKDASPFPRDFPWGRVAGTLGLTVIFAYCLPLLPFFPLAAVFLASLFVLYGHRAPVNIGLVSLIGAAAMDVLFIRILNLPL